MEDTPKNTDSLSPMAALAPLAGLPRQILYQSAFALLSRPLRDLSAHEGLILVSELRPRPEDYARVFQPAYVEAARRAYDALFLAARPLERAPHQTVLRLSMATAAELREFGTQTCEFPGGYVEILDALLPESLWVHWKYVAPGASSGMSYDGLTRLDDRWVWFPKPYRFLQQAKSEPARLASSAPSSPAASPQPAEPATPPASDTAETPSATSDSASSGSSDIPPKIAEMWKE
jgi:hypothetical protein